MKSLASVLFVLLFCATARSQLRHSTPHYWNPTGLDGQKHNPNNEAEAVDYLMGVFDFTQDSGQSCAASAPVPPIELAQIFSDYLKSHPKLVNAGRSAAGVAALAFAEHWPCRK